jgi:hypothetical protein
VTDSGRWRFGSPLRLASLSLLLVLVIGGGVGLGGLAASIAAPPGDVGAASATPGSSGSSGPSSPPSSGPTATPRPTPSPEPTPVPTPSPVAAPLTGLLVRPEAALQHPVAVMIDDHRGARPQAGFNAASVVWHAPAEGGIPRYMLVFQETIPGLVGPVRSARQYYIEWAAEWKAMYVHSGGSPGAMATLRSQGRGQLVWNADEFRYGGTYLWRSDEHSAPHNVYTDGEHLRAMAEAIGAVDGPIVPAWTFGPETGGESRPQGTTLVLRYPYETVTFRYHAATNTYRRFIDNATEPQVDAADGLVVAPANVVILRMRFGALNDGHPEKHRLDAEDVGTGEAIISSNGRIIEGTWSKDSVTGATLLFGPDGEPVTLAPGQTFVQVIALSYLYEVTPGTVTGSGIHIR